MSENATGLTDADLRWLRASFDCARRAADAGDQPYGALLVDEAGNVLAGGDKHRHYHRRLHRPRRDQARARGVAALLVRYAVALHVVRQHRAVRDVRRRDLLEPGRARGVRFEQRHTARVEQFGRRGAAGRDVLGGVARVELLGPALEDEALQVHQL